MADTPPASGLIVGDAETGEAFARLGRNTAFSALSFGLRIGAQVLLLVLAARVLSTAEFGQYTLAISLGSVLVVLADFGLNFLVTREVARRPASAPSHVSNGALAKAWLSGVALLLLPPALWLVGASRTTAVASVIILLSFIANSYGSYLGAVFKGYQRFDYETVASTMLYATLVLTQIAVLWWAPSPVSLALCFLISRAIYFVATLALYRRLPAAAWTRPQVGAAWQMLRSASPFALYTLSAVLSVQFGTVVLSYVGTDVDVGNFQKALRFGMAATIPLAIAEDVFYAFLSRVHGASPQRYRESLPLLNALGAAVIVPMVSAVLLYSDAITRAVYGAGVAPVVAQSLVVVLIAYLLLYFLFLSPTLMSLGQERANLVVWVTGAVVNVVSDVLLIPRHGVIGAAYAMLIAYGVMKVIFVLYSRRLHVPLLDARVFVACLAPHAVLLLLLRLGRFEAATGVGLIGLLGVASLWWLLRRGRGAIVWQASSMS